MKHLNNSAIREIAHRYDFDKVWYWIFSPVRTFKETLHFKRCRQCRSELLRYRSELHNFERLQDLKEFQGR